MHKRLDIQEVKTKAQVDKAYEEYQEFIKVSEMPKYKFYFAEISF